MNLRDLLDGWLNGNLPAPPIVQQLGMRLVEYGEGQAVVEMHAHRGLWNAMGTLHGGVFADLADVAMGVALATVAQEGETFTTSHLEVHFFGSIREGGLGARAVVVRRGRSTAYAECEIRNEAEALLAKASSTCIFQTLSS